MNFKLMQNQRAVEAPVKLNPHGFDIGSLDLRGGNPNFWVDGNRT